jgi:hypothetical protein
MKKLLLGLGLSALTCSTYAALIKDTYETTILHTTSVTGFGSSSLPDIGHLIGRSFVWTVTYDNEATSAPIYTLGPNGIDELGRGDDVVVSIIDMNHWDDLSFVSSALFDLSEYYDLLESFYLVNGLTPRPRAFPVESFFAGFENGEFTTVRNVDWNHLNVAGVGDGAIWGGADFEEGSIDLWGSNQLLSSTEIPISGTFSLFAVAVLGLMVRRRKDHGVRYLESGQAN